MILRPLRVKHRFSTSCIVGSQAMDPNRDNILADEDSVRSGMGKRRRSFSLGPGRGGHGTFRNSGEPNRRAQEAAARASEVRRTLLAEKPTMPVHAAIQIWTSVNWVDWSAAQNLPWGGGAPPARLQKTLQNPPMHIGVVGNMYRDGLRHAFCVAASDRQWKAVRELIQK